MPFSGDTPAPQCICLPWSDGPLRIELPESWRVAGTFAPESLQPADDPRQACRRALDQPIEASLLSSRDLSGRRVLLVVDDVSRPTPVAKFIGPVHDHLLAAGARATDVEVLFALGVHRPMTQAEVDGKIGAQFAAAHRWHNHDAFDQSRLVQLGTTSRGTPVWLNRLVTEFDLIVLLGAVEPHLLLGFSGGYKMLLPGCAGAKTIGADHLQGTEQGDFDYVGVTESPMRLDLKEALSLLDAEVVAVGAALTPDGRIVQFFCGDPILAQRAAAEHVRQHAEVDIAEQVDVVITHSAPFDADLRQGVKCSGNTLFALRPGGVMPAFIGSREGIGDMSLPRVNLPHWGIRSLVRGGCPTRVMRIVNVARCTSPIEERFIAHFGMQLLRRNDLFLYIDDLPPQVGCRMGTGQTTHQRRPHDRRCPEGRRRRCYRGGFPAGWLHVCPRPAAHLTLNSRLSTLPLPLA